MFVNFQSFLSRVQQNENVLTTNGLKLLNILITESRIYQNILLHVESDSENIDSPLVLEYADLLVCKFPDVLLDVLMVRVPFERVFERLEVGLSLGVQFFEIAA